MDYALFVIAFLWAFWAMYVLVMGIYRAHLAKRMTPVTLALSLPFVALGYDYLKRAKNENPFLEIRR